MSCLLVRTQLNLVERAAECAFSHNAPLFQVFTKLDELHFSTWYHCSRFGGGGTDPPIHACCKARASLYHIIPSLPTGCVAVILQLCCGCCDLRR